MKTINVLSTIEQMQLLDALIPANKSKVKHLAGLRNYCIALLMLEAGLRVGETSQLLFMDLYYDKRPVKSIVIRAEIAKNHAERQIPVSVRLLQGLETYYKCYTSDFEALPHSHVFRSKGSIKPITTRQIERIIEDTATRVLGRKVNPHMLRHTFATNLTRLTSTIVIQRLLGHKNLTTTQIYCHPNSQDLTDAIEKLNK